MWSDHIWMQVKQRHAASLLPKEKKKMITKLLIATLVFGVLTASTSGGYLKIKPQQTKIKYEKPIYNTGPARGM